MKKKICLIGLVGAMVAAVGALFARPKVFAAKGFDTGYTCDSIHFGMSDSDHSGYIYGGSSDQTQASKITKDTYVEYYGTNDLIKSFSISTAGSIGATDSIQYAAKLGSGSKAGTMTVVLNKNTIGCDVYVAKYNTDTGDLTVNGKTIKNADIAAKSSSDVGSVAELVTFSCLHVDYSETDTITISTSAKRMFIGDIAIRVKL